MSKITINDSIKADIKSYVTTYLTESEEEISDAMVEMVIDMLVQKFIAIRSFPKTYSTEYITAVVNDYFLNNEASIAFKIPTIVGRIGSEGEVAHNENGISRTFKSIDPLYDVFPDVVQYAKVL